MKVFSLVFISYMVVWGMTLFGMVKRATYVENSEWIQNDEQQNSELTNSEKQNWEQQNSE